MSQQGFTQEFQIEGNVISVPSGEFPYHGGVGNVLFPKMLANKDEVAQIDARTGQKDTYETFLQRCIRTAIAMRSKGITSNDIITVCSSNHLNTCVPLIAALFLSVKFSNTDPILSLSDTVFLLNQVRPKIIFVSPDGVGLIEEAVSQLESDTEVVVFGHSSVHTQFSEFLRESPEEKYFVPVDIMDIKETAAIVFSSGTTGLPKGICLSHMALLAQTIEEGGVDDIPPLVILTFSTPYWISLIISMIRTIIHRSCRLVAPKFDCNYIWSLIKDYQVNVLFLSPTELATICQHEPPNDVDTSSLLFLGTGGGTLSKEQMETARRIFPNVIILTAYGQTELGGIAMHFNVTSNPENIRLAFENPTSSGRPLPGFSYKVVDPQTEEVLGAYQVGEIRIKTEYQMNGYYNLDSSYVWDSDGFIKTGDLAYYDDEYCFYIVDRIKDMLKFQGWQIAPAKLEALLMTHPAIEGAVVIGVPHPIDGDHPMAVVFLKKAYVGYISEKEIKAYVEESVGEKQRLVGGVKIVTRLPVTPSGKFKRKHVKDLVLANKL